MRASMRRTVSGLGAALMLGAVQVGTVVPAYAEPAPGRAEVVSGELIFTAGAGVDNHVEFFINVADGLWHVRDYSAAVVAGTGCEQVGANWVRCFRVVAIRAATLDGNDKLGVREKALGQPTATGREAVPAVAGQAVPAVAGQVTLAAAQLVPMTLSGGPGDDKLTGGWGDDLLDGGPGADVIVDWAGVDTVTYADRKSAVSADPDSVLGDDGERGEGDTISTDVENLIGGGGADTLVGNAAANVLRGGPGADRLAGLAGNDQLYGDAGADLLSGGDGTDVCFADVDDGRPAGCEAVYHLPKDPAVR